MNSNRGIDPMLSSLIGDSMWNTKIIAEPVAISLEQLSLPGERMVSPVPDVLLSPESNPPYSDLEFLWGNERKRVTSIKMEEDDTFSSSPCSTEEVDSSEIDNLDMEECDIKSEINIMEDDGHNMDSDMPLHDSNIHLHLCESDSNSIKTFNMSDVSARKYVDSIFSKIAYVPNPNSTHKEKTQYILSLSDCKDYKLEDILNLDKRSSESARICAKIVQNIPQRYRWECVKPEEIPCCYTIVADCKKLSSRDKPPRPMNAFMIWAQGARRLINELCPKMQNAAISEALGYYWRQKSDHFKKRFEMEKIKLRRFHNIEFPQYKYKPKTKIQKAKEKKELSMSKCKVSKSAVKPEQLEESDLNIPRRKSKYGRPRKTKQIYEPEPTAISKLTPSKCDEKTKSSPTKPAIKDMLTLKILNDRRSKGMTPVNCNGHDRIQNCLGQLSPLEIENPAAGDVFDELRDYEAQMVSRDPPVIDCGSRFITSSVYDTPANTPPIDENDQPLSPLQLPSSSSSSIPQNRSPVPCQQKMDLPSRSSCSSSQTAPGESMPSLKAILSSGTSFSRRGPRLGRDISLSGSLPSAQANNCLRPIRMENDEHRMSTDLMLSCVSELLASPNCGSKMKGSKVNNTNQGNICDVNNNCSWQYNNCGEANPNSGNDAFRPISPVSYTPAFLDFSDLDTLSLDLNVPLLSDDVMKSLLNTL